MPSFQIYSIEDKYKLDKIKDSDVLLNVKTNKSDPQTLKNFLDHSKKHHKNLEFEPLIENSLAKVTFDHEVRLSPKQTAWVSQEKLMIKRSSYLLIGKTEGRVERLISLYLRDIASVKRLVFPDKGLWKFWNNLLKESKKDGYNINLHRIILQKTHTETDEIEELNIHAKDVSTLGMTASLVHNAKRVKVITVRIGGLFENAPKEWMTVRIDRRGSFLVYKQPKKNQLLLDLFDFLLKSIPR